MEIFIEVVVLKKTFMRKIVFKEVVFIVEVLTVAVAVAVVLVKIIAKNTAMITVLNSLDLVENKKVHPTKNDF